MGKDTQNKPRINYIEQIVSFWKLGVTHNFTATDVAVYFYLLEVNNSCGWRKSFSHNNKKIQAVLGISFKTMKAAIQNLKRAELLQYVTQNGSPNIKYQLATLSKFPKVTDKVVDDDLEEVKDKINKTKDIQNIIKGDIDEVFNSYVEIIKSDAGQIWRKAIYEKFKLRDGSLQKLLIEFKLSEISAGKNQLDSDISIFKKHFRNWLNKMDGLGNLNLHKDFRNKKNLTL